MNLFGRGAKSAPEQIETLIGATANFRGTLRSDGGVRVDGAFEGLIETAGNVVVGEKGRVVADISGRNVTVGGAVKGNIDALGRLEILSTGVVYGDVRVQAVMIDEGGQFHGVSRMRGLSHPALAAPTDELDVVLDEVGDESLNIRLDEPIEATARPAPDESLNVRLDEPIEATARPAPDDEEEESAVAVVTPPPADRKSAPTVVTPPPAANRKSAPTVVTPPPEPAPVLTEVAQGGASAPAAAQASPAAGRPADGAKSEARPADGAATGAATANGTVEDTGLDFEVDTIEMDIEPVIPEMASEKPKQGTGQTRRTSGSRR